MFFKKGLTIVLCYAFLVNFSVLSVQAQKGKPVSVTFGQPNIWSLEQAHYLLSQMRERSLGIKAASLGELDPNGAEASRLSLIRQVLGISTEFKQQPSFPTPETTPTPTPTPIPSPAPFPSPIPPPGNQLSNSVLDKLLGKDDFLKYLFSNPKLNASTRLDNNVQLQYEIIAKQLTLLRDETGPDERIVFLELPQSVYASSGNADDKVVRTYWEVAGYGKLNKTKYIENQKTKIIEKSNNLITITSNNYGRFKDDLDDIDDEWRRSLESDIQNNITRLKQQGSRSNSEIISETSEAMKTPGRKFQSTEYVSSVNFNSKAIELIPRQSAVNVTDVREKVKSTFISSAFSFLFGLGIRGQFERQSDLYEQYLHQELYSAGFGKDSNIFGWTFAPVPGTKRVAPGVRVTYAVVKIPKEAESIVLNAKGCFFPRKSYEPPNGINETSANRDWWADGKRECSEQKQQFIIPVPNGGDAKGFWLTGTDYTPVSIKGGRVVASIYGQNFTSQVGVLINGVPLQQVVELTRKLSDRNLIQANCQNPVCGEYEIIDSNEITIVFVMPDDFKGTPNITVIGPGRSVSLNSLKGIKINSNGRKFNHTGSVNTDCKEKDGTPAERIVPCSLNSKEIPFMFGAKAKNELSITDLKITGTNGANSVALLTGTEFKDSDQIFVNGFLSSKFEPKSKTFCTITFPLQTIDTFTVVVKNGDNSDLKTFTIPSTQFRISKAVPISFDKDKNEMFVKLEGNGLDNISLSKVNNDVPQAGSTIIPISQTESLVKIAKPDSVVKLTLRNSVGTEISVVLARPPVE